MDSIYGVVISDSWSNNQDWINSDDFIADILGVSPVSESGDSRTFGVLYHRPPNRPGRASLWFAQVSKSSDRIPVITSNYYVTELVNAQTIAFRLFVIHATQTITATSLLQCHDPPYVHVDGQGCDFFRWVPIYVIDEN
jgi:hypothetical protein